MTVPTEAWVLILIAGLIFFITSRKNIVKKPKNIEIAGFVIFGMVHNKDNIKICYVGDSPIVIPMKKHQQGTYYLVCGERDIDIYSSVDSAEAESNDTTMSVLKLTVDLEDKPLVMVEQLTSHLNGITTELNWGFKVV